MTRCWWRWGRRSSSTSACPSRPGRAARAATIRRARSRGRTAPTSACRWGAARGTIARRSTPSVLYMRFVPEFHYFEDDEAPAPEPRGGFFWDGRADSLTELVRQPLFNPDEMNAGTPRLLARKIARAPYARQFRAALGRSADAEAVLHGVGVALEAYLKSDEMTPATLEVRRLRSRAGDAHRAGAARPGGLQGPTAWRLLRVPPDGRDLDQPGRVERSPNTAYDAIALPRNRELPGSKDPASFDLGLCERKEPKTPSGDEKYCSTFRIPSLRNVAVRQSFGHNGVYKSLREAVSFYARRAVAPDRIYPSGQKFDDVPPKYSGQRQHLRSRLQPQGGRDAADDRGRDRRGGRFPEHADRCARMSRRRRRTARRSRSRRRIEAGGGVRREVQVDGPGDPRRRAARARGRIRPPRARARRPRPRRRRFERRVPSSTARSCAATSACPTASWPRWLPALDTNRDGAISSRGDRRGQRDGRRALSWARSGGDRRWQALQGRARSRAGDGGRGQCPLPDSLHLPAGSRPPHAVTPIARAARGLRTATWRASSATARRR